MQQQQRRLYSFAIGLVAVLTIGSTLAPWVTLDKLGVPASWNGIGRTSDAALADEGVGPHAYGWWVVAAAVVALLAGLLLLGSASLARRAVPVLWVATIGVLAALAVPITALVNPDWLIGDFFHEIGARDLAQLMGRDFLNVPVLIFVIVALLLLAVLCAGTALTLRPIRTRLRISIDRGTDGKPVAKATPAKATEKVSPETTPEDDVEEDVDEDVDEDAVEEADEVPADRTKADER
ncbi:hypothetical protein [Gordonia caeni]|uniref:TIGR02234 family membrane protein n=1 Tax=Gordonia caeni TaxID=1007097 RepID=A0ABP7PIW4_9ACTN